MFLKKFIYLFYSTSVSHLSYTLWIQKTNVKDIQLHPSHISSSRRTLMVNWDEFKSHGQEEGGDDVAGHGCYGPGLSFIGLLSFV